MYFRTYVLRKTHQSVHLHDPTGFNGRSMERQSKVSFLTTRPISYSLRKVTFGQYVDKKYLYYSAMPMHIGRLQIIGYITKTRLYNFNPLKPYFYIVKLGFTGVYIIFLISAQKHRLWVFVRTASARRF